MGSSAVRARLRQLGHDVYFVEPVASRKLRPVGKSLRSSTSASYFRDVVRQFGLQTTAALLLRDTRHSKAARHIAEEYFDANIVLPALLDRVGM